MKRKVGTVIVNSNIRENLRHSCKLRKRVTEACLETSISARVDARCGLQANFASPLTSDVIPLNPQQSEWSSTFSSYFLLPYIFRLIRFSTFCFITNNNHIFPYNLPFVPSSHQTGAFILISVLILFCEFPFLSLLFVPSSFDEPFSPTINCFLFFFPFTKIVPGRAFIYHTFRFYKYRWIPNFSPTSRSSFTSHVYLFHSTLRPNSISFIYKYVCPFTVHVKELFLFLIRTLAYTHKRTHMSPPLLVVCN